MKHFYSDWFIRDMKYFSTTLEEYKVIYPDGTPDYIATDDFDGVQVVFLDVNL